MNKPKLFLASTSKVLLNVFLVCLLVVLASLIGVGGAALWIYSHTGSLQTSAKASSPRLKSNVASEDNRRFPMLTPVQSDDDAPSQLTPARYVPTDSEIATLSETPRYTNISYNGGRQQAHLRVNMVLTESAPAPLADSSLDSAASTQAFDRPPLTDSTSRYITDAKGRVVGIDGSAGADQEDIMPRVTVARTTPVQSGVLAPEVRVAYPVATRKALPVDADESALPVMPSAFDVRAELSRDDDERPVLAAQPVARTSRPVKSSVFGASDDFRSFGRN